MDECFVKSFVADLRQVVSKVERKAYSVLMVYKNVTQSDTLLRNTFQLPPTDKRACAGLQGLIAAKDHITLLFRRSGKLAPIFDIIKVTIGNRFTGFNLNRHDFFVVHQQAVDLFAAAILPKIWRTNFAAIEIVLNKLVDDQILKKRAFHVMQVDLNRELGFRSVRADSCVVRQPRIIKQLTHAPGAQLSELDEGIDIPDIFHQAHILFDVGLNVGGIKISGSDGTVINAGY